MVHGEDPDGGTSMITREADYAIRALLCLARRHGEQAWVPATEVAAQMEIPYRFLRNIVGALVRHELVLSQRGRSGGLMLARPPQRISLMDAMAAFGDGCCAINICVARDPAACERVSHCTVHPKLRNVQDMLDGALRGVTLDQLM